MGFFDKFKNVLESGENFRYLDSLIKNGSNVIVLDSNISLSDNERSDFFNGIKIDEDNVVIDGNGHTINAKGKTRIFNITGKNITVKNIIFKNGFCREGGAIYNSGEMDIHDCTFMNNKSDDEGGAIKNNGKLNVSNSSLDSNESVRGGGIYNYENCFLHLDNCTFSNNRDAVRNMGKLIVQSCTFSNNTGSAMHNEGEVTIDDSSFFGNTSKFSGGAIYNSRRISIRNSSFKNNKAGEKYSDDIYNDGNLLLFKLNFSNQFKTIFNRNVINASKYLTEKIYCESSGSRGSISGHEMIHEVNLLKENQKDFTYLNNLIANGNGEIKLKEDILLNPINKEEITFNEGIRIERDNLTIDGDGHTIDAQNLTRIFYVTGRNVVMRNIVFKNGLINQDGGAIYNNGDLTIEGSTLYGNNAIDGGAIYNFEANLNMGNCKLYDNVSRGHVWECGGAINNFKGNLIINDCSFFRNNADNGGAITNSGRLSIVDSDLFENSANEGVIYNKGDLENKGSLIVTNCTFDNNDADGGVMYNLGIQKLFNCEISNNSSFYRIIHNEEHSEIYNTNFKKNKTKNIIFSNDGYGTAYCGIEACEFVDNDIDEFVIYNGGKECNISKTIFRNNLSYNEGSKNIYNKSILTFKLLKIEDKGRTILNEGHITFNDYMQDIDGMVENLGVVDLIDIPNENKFDFTYLDNEIHKNTSNVFVLRENITFENYEKNFYEGGIELDVDNLVIDGDGKIIDGCGKSRIFLITGKNITLKNIIFKNGLMDKQYFDNFNNHGGALRINKHSNLKIENCEFINNIVKEQNGGAIYNRGILDIFDSKVQDNKARNGGAIFNDGELSISNSEFYDNVANWMGKRNGANSENMSENGNGGVIYNGGNLNINECNLENNKADIAGAIFNELSLDMFDSLLSNNCAKEGGAIYNIAKLSIKNCEFSNNKTGGISKIKTEDNHLSFREDSLDQNKLNKTSKDGGAIYNDGELNILDSIISANKARNGGAIYNRGYLTIKDSTCCQNELYDNYSNQGGAIYNKGHLIIKDSTLSFNKTLDSYSSGGAISNDNNVNIINSKLLNNKSRSGGAIYNNGDLLISGSHLCGNLADKWGGSISNDCNLTIDNSNFANNKSKRLGGALSNSENAISNIKNCTFNDNRSGNGGAISNYSNYENRKGYLTITYSSLSNNVADEFGGAIYCKILELKYENCTFKDNGPDDVHEETD